jgi:hypothetical protein
VIALARRFVTCIDAVVGLLAASFPVSFDDVADSGAQDATSEMHIVARATRIEIGNVR